MKPSSVAPAGEMLEALDSKNMLGMKLLIVKALREIHAAGAKPQILSYVCPALKLQ